MERVRTRDRWRSLCLRVQKHHAAEARALSGPSSATLTYPDHGGPMSRKLTTVPRPVDVDRLIYATITLMTVLIIYDGWQQLKFREVVGIIVGPVLAMFLSHVFSASLAQQLVLGRPVTMVERRA